MQHPINLMLWQNSSSIEWLAQFLDFGKDLIKIFSCWQSLMKRFLPKSTNSLCTRYRLWSRTSVVRMWACKAAFCDACYVWTASLLEVVFSSRKAQVWHNQPKHRSNNQSKHSKQKSAPSKDGNACSHSGTMCMDENNAFTYMLSMMSYNKIMCHPGNWCFFWWINTYQNKSKQVWKEVKKSPKIRQEKKICIYIYTSKYISDYQRNTSQHISKNLSKEISKKHIKKKKKKHIKTPIFGFQPLSLGCGPLSLGRGPQDSKHKSEPTFSPKNQTPKFAIIFFAQCALTVRSSILSQNSKSYHAIPDKDSLPKMFDHE